MASGKKRNPLNLSLPPTVNEEGTKDDGTDEQNKDSLNDQLQNLSLSRPQKERMSEWFSKKQKVNLRLCFWNFGYNS